MKKSRWLVLLTTAIIMASCSFSEVGDTSLIYGLWEEKSNDVQKEYMRFLNSSEDPADGEYLFGKEWDEEDGVKESDLKYHGNGWFKWKKAETTLTMIELMDNGAAEYPKSYVIKKLTATELILQDAKDTRDIDTLIKK